MKTSQLIGCTIVLILSLLVLPAPVLGQANAACALDITVVPGDTLTGLASRHLGDPLAFNRIIAATNARAATDASYATVADEAILQIGWKLCIPAGTAPVASPARTAPLDPLSGGGQADPAITGIISDTLPFDGESLTIDFLRRQQYPGSPLVVEEALAPGANYDRYLVSYRSEGLKIYALLTVPQGARPATGWPVIVFNHGYIPPDVYRTTERYVAYVDGFARNGYIVFRPDYRGHGFSEGEASGAYGSPDYTVDVLNAVATIKQYAHADPNRIGMWGHSMGGYIALRAMVASQDVKAGVIWAGVVASYPDLLERWNRRSSTVTASITTRARRWRQQLVEQYGTPGENPAFWNSISANSFLEDLSGPIQIHHGTADTSVPVEFSVKLFDQIEAAGGYAEIYTYLGDDHNIAQNLNQAITRSVAFFDRYLKASG